MCALCGVRWRGGIGGTGEVAGDEAKIDAFEQPGASQAVEFGGSEPEPRHTAIDLKHSGERPSGGPGKTGPAMHLFERIEAGNGAGVAAGRLRPRLQPVADIKEGSGGQAHPPFPPPGQTSDKTKDPAGPAQPGERKRE